MIGNGDPVSDGVIDADSYRMNGKLYLKLINGSKEFTFLIAEETAQSLNLHIEARQVLVTSQDLKKVKDGKPLMQTGPCTFEVQNDTGSAFVGTDGINIIFSVESFRLTPGTATNSFVYEFKDGTKPENYQILTRFGTITVTEAS